MLLYCITLPAISHTHTQQQNVGKARMHAAARKHSSAIAASAAADAEMQRDALARARKARSTMLHLLRALQRAFTQTQPVALTSRV